MGGLNGDRLNLNTLHNTSPLQVQGRVDAIPMNQDVFTYGGGDQEASTLPLYDSSGQLAGYVRHFDLVTMAPGDTLVAFANRQTGISYSIYLPLIVR